MSALLSITLASHMPLCDASLPHHIAGVTAFTTSHCRTETLTTSHCKSDVMSLTHHLPHGSTSHSSSAFQGTSSMNRPSHDTPMRPTSSSPSPRPCAHRCSVAVLVIIVGVSDPQLPVSCRVPGLYQLPMWDSDKIVWYSARRC
jgi:hypothetical protein